MPKEEKKTAPKAAKADAVAADEARTEEVTTSYEITNGRDCCVPVFANGAILNVGAGKTTTISEEKFALLSNEIDVSPYLSVKKIGGSDV